MNDLSSILQQQEKLGVNTRAYSYNQFKQIAKISPSQTQTQMFPDLILNKIEKREMIKSLLKYNPNKAFDNKKIKQIESELKQKFMRKNKSEQRFATINNATNNILMVTNNNINNSSKKLHDINQKDNNEELYNNVIAINANTDRLQSDSLQQQQQQYQQYLQQQQIYQQQQQQQLLLQQQQQQHLLMSKKNGRVLYERLQNQFKDYVVGGQSNYKFYAQKKLNNDMNNIRNKLSLLSPQNINLTSALSPQEIISNLKSTQNAGTHLTTEKAKRFIFDKSSMNKSTQKLGINLPSPLVYKNQIGLINQSQLRRYEAVIGKLQQLALRLDLNKNQLSEQRPILRNFVELHKISMPKREIIENIEDMDEEDSDKDNENHQQYDEIGEKLKNEEKIIKYVEERKFLEVNDIIKSLKTIEDHFEYAVYGKLKQYHNENNNNNNNMSNTNILDITTRNNISIMNQSQSVNFITQPHNNHLHSLQRDNSSQKIVYNEGCGIALVNEKIGKFDASTIQYFEQGITLKKVMKYMKVLADIKNYVILEGNLLKIYKFQENEVDGRGKWIVINNIGNNNLEYIFDCKTLYALSAYQNVTHN